MSLNIIHVLYQDTDFGFIILNKKIVVKIFDPQLFTLALSYPCVVPLPIKNLAIHIQTYGLGLILYVKVCPICLGFV